MNDKRIHQLNRILNESSYYGKGKIAKKIKETRGYVNDLNDSIDELGFAIEDIDQDSVDDKTYSKIADDYDRMQKEFVKFHHEYMKFIGKSNAWINKL